MFFNGQEKRSTAENLNGAQIFDGENSAKILKTSNFDENANKFVFWQRECHFNIIYGLPDPDAIAQNAIKIGKHFANSIEQFSKTNQTELSTALEDLVCINLDYADAIKNGNDDDIKTIEKETHKIILKIVEAFKKLGLNLNTTKLDELWHNFDRNIKKQIDLVLENKISESIGLVDEMLFELKKIKNMF